MLSHFSRVRLLATPWTVACQAPLSRKFSGLEYWGREPFSPPGDLPYPGIKTVSAVVQVDSLLSEPPGKPEKIMIHALMQQM